MNDFVFRGRLRRTARALVAVMVPRWPDFDKDITEEVLDEVEALIRQMPVFNQVGISLMLAGLEFAGGPMALDGIRPLSSLDHARAVERIERLADHPLPQVRMLPMLLGTLISFSAYSREDVEQFLGLRRREWRRDRRALRDALVQIDIGKRAAGQPAPPTPTPLGGEPHVTPDTYLLFEAERAARADQTHAAEAG